MSLRLFVWPPVEGADLPKDYVGVTIESWGANGVHVGIIYRTSQGGVWVLHHRGHFNLEHDAPSAGQIIAVCPIDPLQIPTIARFFRQLYRENRAGFPYGFNFAAAQWFLEDGVYAKPVDALGFCCQTFVLAAYSAAGVQLIEPLDSAPREDDASRQIALLDSFQQQLETARPEYQRHFEAVRNAVGTSLCRPLEVGGAALADTLPCAFAEAVQLSQQIAAFF